MVSWIQPIRLQVPTRHLRDSDAIPSVDISSHVGVGWVLNTSFNETPPPLSLCAFPNRMVVYPKGYPEDYSEGYPEGYPIGYLVGYPGGYPEGYTLEITFRSL